MASRPPSQGMSPAKPLFAIAAAFGVGYSYTNQDQIKSYFGYGPKVAKFRVVNAKDQSDFMLSSEKDASNRPDSNPNFSRLSDQKPEEPVPEEPVPVEVQATEEVPEEIVAEEVEDNGRASSRNFEDFEEQDDGANPIEIEKPEEVAPVVEEQPACEEPVTEEAAIEVEAPVVEAEVEPVVEAEPTVEAITEDVVATEETVVSEVTPDEPIAETAVEVTEESLVEAVPEEAAEVVPEVQEEAQPVEEVPAEPVVDAVEGEEAISELQVQIGNYSRIAAKSTEDLILSYERAAKSIIEFIRAKKYAFGFKGDTDRKVAIWLQVAEYQSEMDKCIQLASEADVESSMALDQLINVISETNIQNWMGIEEEVDSMKSRILSATDVLNSAKSSLEKLKEIEDEVEAALEPKRQNLRELFGEPEDEAEDWKLLNPKFSQDDLKGLIFIAQKKIESYNAELVHLRENQDKITAEALQQQREELMAATQAQIDALEALQNEKIEARRNEIRSQLLEEHESDLELQLKRQAAAHSLHLSEELALQENALREKYSTKIDQEVDSVIQKYKQQIENERTVLNMEIEKQETLNARITSELRGYLEGINATINERTKTEQEVTSLQTLSVGVARLNKAICDDNTTPLSSMINDLLKIKSEATLLEPVLNSIPSEAAERGVVNNNNLRKHFNTLKQAAFENHAVDEELNGFFQILRSQITLWFHRKDPTGFLIQDSVSNLEQIFDQAESHMNQNDFETAVRILNQMSGEPKRIFGVWLKEARMWLEVRQALDVLLTMSEVRALSVRCLS